MRLTVTLDPSSIAEACRRLEAYADALPARCDALCAASGERAASVARENCRVDTGELASSIRVEGSGGSREVVCDGDGAAFHEFGTGLGRGPVNRASALAMGDAGWQPDATGRGEAGWAYPDPEGGWSWTHGQDGRGFMGAGATAARHYLADDAREAFRSE